MPTALGYLLDLDAPTTGGAVGDRMEFQYNPETVKWSVASTWAEHKILGGSHPRLQWTSTGGWKRPLTVQVVREDSARPSYVRERLDWLESLLLPDTGSDGAVTRGAHRLLLVLGDMIGAGASPGRQVILRGLSVTVTSMDTDLLPRMATVDLDLEEYRTSTLTSRTVRP